MQPGSMIVHCDDIHGSYVDTSGGLHILNVTE